MGDKHAQKRNFFRFAKTETSQVTVGGEITQKKGKKNDEARGGRPRPKPQPLIPPQAKRAKFTSMNTTTQKNSILKLFTKNKSITPGGKVNRPSLFNIGRVKRDSKQPNGGARRSTLNLFNLFNPPDTKGKKVVKINAADFDKDKWEIRQTISGRKYYWNTTENIYSWEKPEELMTSSEKEQKYKEWVWVPHPINYLQPAVIVAEKANGAKQVRLMNNKLVTIPAIKVMKGAITNGATQRVPLTPLKRFDLDVIVDDLVELETVNEGTVLHNTRLRFEQQQIYTWIGPSRNVLLAVNPYEDLGLYTEAYKKKYENSAVSLDTPKPHVFAIAAVCVHKLATQGRSQSILVSGESGSGKTQATKQCLDFITYIAGSTKIMPTKKVKKKTVQQKAPGKNGRARRKRKDRRVRQMPGEGGVIMANAGSENAIEDKILNCNPIMEAFGNAKTVRNNNSSRFGKWIVMYMNMKRKQVIGAKIEQFLLETTRVISQAENERNYHVFYQVFTDEELCQKYNLTSPEDFIYTNQGNCYKVEGQQPIDDAKEMSDVKVGMEKLGFRSEEIEWFYTIVCSILHIGNVTFSKSEEDNVCFVSESDNSLKHFENAAEILEIDSEKLSAVMTTRTIRTSKDTTTKNLTLKQANNARNSLAKAIYGKLFSYLIERINEAFGSTNGGRFIGILDIFGFECFKYNSFEQLCINFTNERLQKLFNETTFLEEQELYKMEKINFDTIKFANNQLVLDIIDTKPHGIFNLLDDECKAAKSSTLTLLRRINGQHREKYKLFSCFEDTGTFEIKHFAGKVVYTVADFVEKNIDSLNQDIYEVCSNSKNVYTNVLFPPMKSFEKVRIKSTSGRFREQLASLLNVLEDTQCHFIRCIKPNDEQIAKSFNGRKIKTQFDSGAIVDAVLTRKKGFAHKMFHEDFFEHYKKVNGFNYKYNMNRDPKGLCRDLIKQCFEQSFNNLKGIQVGDTRVMFKTEEYKVLELNKTIAVLEPVVHLQALFRGQKTRKKFNYFKQKQIELKKAIKDKDLDKIEEIEVDIQKNLGKGYKISSKKLNALKEDIKKQKGWAEVTLKYKKYDDVLYSNLDKEEISEDLLKSLDVEDLNEAVNDLLKAKKEFGNKFPVDVKITFNRVVKLRQILLNNEFSNMLNEDNNRNINNKNTLRQEELRNSSIRMSTPEEFAKQEQNKAIEYIETEGKEAINNLDRKVLENMELRAMEFGYESPIVNEIKNLLNIPEIEFLKKQIQIINQNQNNNNEQELNKNILLEKTLQLKEAELIENFNKYKQFHKLSTLRNPPEEVNFTTCFCIPYRTGVREQSLEAAKQLYGDSAENRLLNKKRKYLVWQNDDFLYFSILRLPNDLEDIAFVCFEQVFAYMEEFRSEQDGLSLIKTGVFKGGGNNPGLRNEIFAQIIKQLTRNPTAESRIRGVELLGLCLASFRPDDEEFENYLYIWLRLHLPLAIYKNYMAAVHTLQFTTKKRRNNGANTRIKENTDLSEIRKFLDEAREINFNSDPDKWMIPEGMFKNILSEYDIDEDFLNDELDFENESEHESRFSKTLRNSVRESSKYKAESSIAPDSFAEVQIERKSSQKSLRKSKKSIKFSTVGGESIDFGFTKKKPKKKRNRTAKKQEIVVAKEELEEVDTKTKKKDKKKNKRKTESSEGIANSMLEIGFDQPEL